MDTNRLRYFVTVAQTQNLRRASEMLRISSPALSKAMKVLEKEVNKKLIIQNGRGIAITDEGLRLSEKAQKILAAVDDLDGLRDLLGQKETLRLASTEVFTTHFLGKLAKDHINGFDLELHELLPGKLEDALLSRKIDIGISYVPIPHPDLDFLKVTSYKMAIYGKKSVFDKTKFEDLPFAVPISPIEGAPNRIRGMDGWPDCSLPRYRKYQVTLMESALELCRSGLAVGYFPKFVIDIHNQTVRPQFELQALSLPKNSPNESQDVFIIKRKTDQEDRRIKKIAKALRIICQN